MGRGVVRLFRSAADGFLVVLAAVSLVACGGNEVPNRPPTATLEPGFVQGDTVSYALSISWSGSDPDGRIVRFEYAIDPPPAFSEDEIAHGGPGITNQEIPASGDSPAKTRVIKSSGGQATFFDWVHTQDTSHDFAFSATQADSAGPDSMRVPTGRFYGMHALYLRAVDNDGAVSEPDRVAFTSRTIAPTGLITNLPQDRPVVSTGLKIRVRWSGEDPDGPAPVQIRYKLVPLPGVSTNDLYFADDLLPYLAPLDQGWSIGLAPYIDFDLIEGMHYVLAIRVVDEAGATDPFLDRGRNLVAFVPIRNAPPFLSLYGPTVGDYTFPENESTPPAIPVGFPISFRWEAYSGFGGEVAGYSWGLDINDPSRDEEWGLWGWSRATGPFLPPSLGVHTLSVRALDIGGGVSHRTIAFEVIKLPFDRNVLYVDDYISKTYPRAVQEDAFWQRLFQDYESYAGWGAGAIDEIHAFGAYDAGSFDPPALPLAQLGRYKLIIWNNLGSGVNGISSLVRTASIHRDLAFYLMSGGKLWVTGGGTMEAMVESPNGINGDPDYPLVPSPGTFAHDFMKIRAPRVDNDKKASPDNSLNSADPYPGSSAGLDSMVVDTGKLNPVTVGRGDRIGFADAIKDPLATGLEPGFRGILEPLYTYGAAGPALSDTPSPYQGKVCALRWHDPDPDRAQGRVMWFGFPMYYFKDDQARDTFRKAIDWFREETRGELSP